MATATVAPSAEADSPATGTSLIADSDAPGATARWTTGFSKERVTAARPSGLRPADPAKMTSVISLPRSDLLDRSPSTHLIASTTLDLPHPLGPTMAVTGSSKVNSVRSAKDLKP